MTAPVIPLAPHSCRRRSITSAPSAGWGRPFSAPPSRKQTSPRGADSRSGCGRRASKVRVDPAGKLRGLPPGDEPVILAGFGRLTACSAACSAWRRGPGRDWAADRPLLPRGRGGAVRRTHGQRGMERARDTCRGRRYAPCGAGRPEQGGGASESDAQPEHGARVGRAADMPAVHRVDAFGHKRPAVGEGRGVAQ